MPEPGDLLYPDLGRGSPPLRASDKKPCENCPEQQQRQEVEPVQENGRVPTTLSVTVSQSEVRRLMKLQARAEGATQVAQAAVNAAQAAQQALAIAVQEACLDEGLKVPSEATADIDWKTGEITITPPAPPVPSVRVGSEMATPMLPASAPAPSVP